MSISKVKTITKEVKVMKTFDVVRTLIEGANTLYNVKLVTGETIPVKVKAEKIVYKTITDLFSQQAVPLPLLPYDCKKNFDLLAHAVLKIADYTVKVLPMIVEGNLGYWVEFETKDLKCFKRITVDLQGNIIHVKNIPVRGLNQTFVGHIVVVALEMLFKEEIDLDNGTATLGIVNRI